MKLYFLRHATATDLAPSDAERPLTAVGRDEARSAGSALARLGCECSHILSSPLVRARQTAGVWSVVFTAQPLRRSRDFARFAMDKTHPIQRGYRNWLLDRGIYVHPHYMIRGFLTGAHTDEDVDQLIDATASYLRTYRDLLV